MPLQHWGERDGEGIDAFLLYLERIQPAAAPRVSWPSAVYQRVIAIVLSGARI